MKKTYHEIKTSYGDVVIKATYTDGGSLVGKVSIKYYGEENCQELFLEKSTDINDLQRTLKDFYEERP